MRQTNLSFAPAAAKRPALEELDPNRPAKVAKKAKEEDAAAAGAAAASSSSSSSSSTPAAAPAPAPAPASASLTALMGISRALAAATLQRLVLGYRDKSGSSYGPAVRNEAGCLLAQKGANRVDNGYVQIAPISTGVRGLAGSKKSKPLPQNAHRLVVVAHHSDEDRERLFNGAHASHRCHQPTCIEPGHIVVESKEANEARKRCRGKDPIIKTVIEGIAFTLPPPTRCECLGGPCISIVERREALRD